jgi:putative flippase GtrA
MHCSPPRGEVRRGRAAHHHSMFRVLLLVVAIFLVATFPATYLLMLFFGNIGQHLSYWGTFPLGVLVSWLLGFVGSRWTSWR